MNAKPYNRLIAEMDRIWLLIPEADRYEHKPSETAEAGRLRFAVEDLIEQASPSPAVMAEIDAALARAVEHIAGVALEGPKMPGLPAPRWSWYVDGARAPYWATAATERELLIDVLDLADNYHYPL